LPVSIHEQPANPWVHRRTGSHQLAIAGVPAQRMQRRCMIAGLLFHRIRDMLQPVSERLAQQSHAVVGVTARGGNGGACVGDAPTLVDELCRGDLRDDAICSVHITGTRCRHGKLRQRTQP
jgi:hypothetical protein